MKQQYKSGAVAAAPGSLLAPSVGNPTEGDVAANTPATVIGAYAFYQLFKELEAIIEDGVDGNGDAMVPDLDVLTQVRDALRSKYLAKADAVSGGVTGASDAKSAAYTVVAGDNGKTLEVDASAAARTITLPDLDGDDDGFAVTVMKTDSSANEVTVDGNGNDQVNGAATYALKEQYEAVILKWTGSQWLAIGGATGALLRDFFGGASKREFTTAGAHNYSWEWGTPNGLAIIEGAAGGGGGGGGGGARSSGLSNGGSGGGGGGPDGGNGGTTVSGQSPGAGGDGGTGTGQGGGNESVTTYNGSDGDAAGGDSGGGGAGGEGTGPAVSARGGYGEGAGINVGYVAPNESGAGGWGGGGGGAGGGYGAPSTGGTSRRGGGGGGGAAGTAGTQSSVTVDGNTYSAAGGAAGPGGGGGSGAKATSTNDSGRPGGTGGGGDGGDGGTGASTDNDGGDGGAGHKGALVFQLLADLSEGDQFAITVGAGGTGGGGGGGGGGDGADGGDGDNGPNGANGRVTLIPLF